MGESVHECAVVGVYLKEGRRDDRGLAFRSIYDMLFELRKRGQRSSGAGVYDPSNKGIGEVLKLWKEVGSIKNFFNGSLRMNKEAIIKHLEGVAGIGHNRYSTSAKGSCHSSGQEYWNAFKESQPFRRTHGRPWKDFLFAFNGHLANYPDLRKDLTERGYELKTSTDTEAMVHFISLELARLAGQEGKMRLKPDMFGVFANACCNFDGAYNTAFLSGDGDLIVSRDTWGFHPLVVGENDDLHAFASESIALERIGIFDYSDVEPGEYIIINESGLKRKRMFEPERTAHCHFEYNYFSRVESSLDGVSVNRVRRSLGMSLADIVYGDGLISGKKSDYVVVPVPFTGIPAAESFAKALGLDCTMAITLNDIDRGFINPEATRKEIMSHKYGIIREVVKDKKIFAVDDSIVRAETSKILVGMLRDAGAGEVYLLSTDPPIRNPCFYGIDHASFGELVVNRFGVDGVADYIGADAVVYQSVDGVVSSIGLPRSELCLACLNGEYPTHFGKRNAERALMEFKSREDR